MGETFYRTDTEAIHGSLDINWSLCISVLDLVGESEHIAFDIHSVDALGGPRPAVPFWFAEQPDGSLDVHVQFAWQELQVSMFAVPEPALGALLLAFGLICETRRSRASRASVC
jgi:hypothetical protein